MLTVKMHAHELIIKFFHIHIIINLHKRKHTWTTHAKHSETHVLKLEYWRLIAFFQNAKGFYESLQYDRALANN